jgi:hypothetical protein
LALLGDRVPFALKVFLTAKLRILIASLITDSTELLRHVTSAE